MNAKASLDPVWLADFCRRWRVREFSLFGSALRDDLTPDSDIDYLVSFEPDAPVDIDFLLDMKEELEGQVGRPVDLVEKEVIRNPWKRREILRTREVLHAS